MTARETKGPLPWVVVSLTTGGDIRGVLREEFDDALVLAGAAVAGEQNGQTVWKNLVGEVVIPMERVEYWQQGLPPEVTNEWAKEGS